jgi:cytochrome bd-type quinol oxidase subunit 2
MQMYFILMACQCFGFFPSFDSVIFSNLSVPKDLEGLVSVVDPVGFSSSSSFPVES